MDDETVTDISSVKADSLLELTRRVRGVDEDLAEAKAKIEGEIVELRATQKQLASTALVLGCAMIALVILVRKLEGKIELPVSSQ